MALNNLGGAAFESGDYAEANRFYTRSLQLCRMIGDRLGEGRALNNLEITSVTQAAYAQAESYYLQGLKISYELGHRSFEMSALDNLGNLAFYRYNYNQAEKYLLEALEGTRAIGDRMTESFVLANLGRVYLCIGDTKRAQDTLQESYDLNKQLGDQKGSCIALIYLSQCKARVEEVQTALEYCEEALALARDLDVPTEQGSALHTLGIILHGQGRNGEAVESFRQALVIWQEQADSRETVGTLAGLGSAYLCLGDLPRAVECVELILAHIAKDGVEGFEGPVKVFLSCYQILSAAQDARAADILWQGNALLQETASKFEDETMRRFYLERVPENRAMMEAWEKTSRTE